MGYKLQIWSCDPDCALFGAAQKSFIQDVKWKMYSKFGKDQSKSEATI